MKAVKAVKSFSLSCVGPEFGCLLGAPVAAGLLEGPQLGVFAGPVGRHVAVFLQQDAVQRVLVVDVPPHHQHVLPALLQVGAVAHVGDPQELAVLQAVAVAVGVDDLDVVARLLPAVQLPHDFASEHEVPQTILPPALPAAADSSTLPTMPSRRGVRQEVSVLSLQTRLVVPLAGGRPVGVVG